MHVFRDYTNAYTLPFNMELKIQQLKKTIRFLEKELISVKILTELVTTTPGFPAY